MSTTTKLEVARPLKVLVPLIKADLEAGGNAGIEHYRAAGEKLIEAKSQCDEGEWTGWLKRNFALSHSSARKYMKLAEETEGLSDRRRSASLTSIVDPSNTRRKQEEKEVRRVVNRVDVKALAEDRHNAAREERLIVSLAKQLVDIGYRVLATKLHPDKPGGSKEAMQRLNKAKELLTRTL